MHLIRTRLESCCLYIFTFENIRKCFSITLFSTISSVYNQWYFVLQTLRCFEEKRTIPLRMSMEFNIRQDNCQLSTAACLLSAAICLTITSITCTLLFITIRILVSCAKDSRRYDIPQM